MVNLCLYCSIFVMCNALSLMNTLSLYKLVSAQGFEIKL